MAYRCPLIGGKKCPEKADKDGGCPAWVTGVVEVEAITQVQRITSDCMFRLLPRWLMQGMAGHDGVRAEMSAMRGAVANAVATTVNQAIESGEGIPINLIDGGS